MRWKGLNRESEEEEELSKFKDVWKSYEKIYCFIG